MTGRASTRSDFAELELGLDSRGTWCMIIVRLAVIVGVAILVGWKLSVQVTLKLFTCTVAMHSIRKGKPVP